MSAEREKNVTSRGCVNREVQQPLLQNATSVERTKTVYREGWFNWNTDHTDIVSTKIWPYRPSVFRV